MNNVEPINDVTSYVALVHQSDCVPMDRPSSTRCEADSYVQGPPCPNRADYKFGIGGGWSHICYHHYQDLPDAEGCDCLDCGGTIEIDPCRPQDARE